MWEESKIEQKKDYFIHQLKSKNGNYTDFVIRTYYYILVECRKNNSNWCFGKEAADSKIMYFVYANVSDGRPDHEGANIVMKIKQVLKEMGYISFKKENDIWKICILKDLDFLDCNIDEYIKNSSKMIATSKLEKAKLVYEYLNKNGIYIVKYNRLCWKCKNYTTIYSYYLGQQVKNELQNNIELCDKNINSAFEPDMSSYLNNISIPRLFDEIGIGVIKKLDMFLAKKIDTIKETFSKSSNCKYYANICEKCGALQGINFVVYSPKVLEELEYIDIKKLVELKVYPSEIDLSIEEIENLIK